MGSKVSAKLPSMEFGLQQAKSPAQKAEFFKDFFSSHCKLAEGVSSRDLLPFYYLIDFRLPLFQFVEGEVLAVLLSLDVNKASGPDGISNRMLKETARSISSSLTDVFNFSLRVGVYPSQWKEAKVTPVHKTGC